MNLNQLKIFYFAVKAKNLSSAADQLGVTQPAVTKGIQRLQEHYELKLIDYVGKKLALTDAGEVLFRDRGEDLRPGNACRGKHPRFPAAQARAHPHSLQRELRRLLPA